jgi:hypothetical protein
MDAGADDGKYLIDAVQGGLASEDAFPVREEGPVHWKAGQHTMEAAEKGAHRRRVPGPEVGTGNL